MLLLAYLTISYHRWNQAQVTILTVVDSDDAESKPMSALTYYSKVLVLRHQRRSFFEKDAVFGH